MVESVCDRTSQPKREGHTGSSNTKRDPPVPHQEAQVHLEPNQKEEENQSNIGGR